MLICLKTAIVAVVVSLGVTGFFLADYKLRFGEKLNKSRFMIIGIPLFCGAVSLLFNCYGYAPVKLVELICLASGLMVTAKVDKEKMIIPNEYLILLTVIWGVIELIGCILYGDGFIGIVVPAFFGMLLGVSVFVFARIISPKSIGMGDIKLFAVLGLYFGTDNILRVVLASLLMAALAGSINVMRRKLSVKESMCMGPYIALGSMIVMVLGV